MSAIITGALARAVIAGAKYIDPGFAVLIGLIDWCLVVQGASLPARHAKKLTLLERVHDRAHRNLSQEGQGHEPSGQLSLPQLSPSRGHPCAWADV